jgi:hypothetical protein
MRDDKELSPLNASALRYFFLSSPEGNRLFLLFALPVLLHGVTMATTINELQEQYNLTMSEWGSLRLMCRSNQTLARMKQLGTLAIEVQGKIGAMNS